MPAMTRPVTIMLHENIYEALKTAAEQDTAGNVNRYVRVLIYTKLVASGVLDAATLMEVYTGDDGQ